MKNNELIEKLDKVGLVGISELVQTTYGDYDFDLDQWKNYIIDTLVDIALDVIEFNEDREYKFNYIKDLIFDSVVLYKEVK